MSTHVACLARSSAVHLPFAFVAMGSWAVYDFSLWKAGTR
jgi:hypothetical protein